MSPLLAPTAERAHGFHQPQAFAGRPRSAGGMAGIAARDEAVSFQAASQAPSPHRWERHPSNHSHFPQRGRKFTGRAGGESHEPWLHQGAGETLRGPICMLLQPASGGKKSLVGAAGRSTKQGKHPSTPRNLAAPTMCPASAPPIFKQ